ncbi:unnamed protein product [Timema podura]|uniref:Uncharacterized protein n=1 Tax=Timema podura TaxID=61482 RepID=A0ABN7P6S4_TIMPD|nr:unnamed protein product [Timema podura]
MLTGVDALSVRVKQKKDCHVYKTPLIILTNNRIGFMYELAFVDRAFSEQNQVSFVQILVNSRTPNLKYKEV